MVDLFGGEDLIDGVGVKEAEVIIVHLELACLDADYQLVEHACVIYG